jgi:Zn-dependent protease
VPVEAAALRHPIGDRLQVALVGPASNLLLAILFAALARVAPEGGPWAAVARAGVVWNCSLALLNLIPIPPLDGSWVLMRFLPLRHIIALRQHRIVGLALVLVVAISPLASRLLLQTPLRLGVDACLALFGVPRIGPAT